MQKFRYVIAALDAAVTATLILLLLASFIVVCGLNLIEYMLGLIFYRKRV